MLTKQVASIQEENKKLTWHLNEIIDKPATAGTSQSQLVSMTQDIENIEETPVKKVQWEEPVAKTINTSLQVAELEKQGNDKIKPIEPSPSSFDRLAIALEKMVAGINLKGNTLMELPYFDGNHKEWPKFRAIYRETTERAGFTDLENLNRLQKHLKGNALRTVNALMHDSNNVEAIVDRLEKRYGDPNAVYDALLSDLTSVREPTLERPSTFINFINALNSMIANMTILHREDYLYDQRLLRDLVAKLPSNIRNKWLIERQHSSHLSLKDLSEFLKPTEELAIMLDSREYSTRKPNHLNSVRTPPKLVSRDRCFICHNQHKTVDCRQLRESSVDQRWTILRNNNICTNCCNFSNHSATNCRLPPQCSAYGCR